MMQNMCRRVANGYFLTTFPINLRFDLGLRCNFPFYYLTLMNEQIWYRFYSIDNFELCIFASYHTNITDLTTGVSVEGCLVEYHGNFLSFMDARR